MKACFCPLTIAIKLHVKIFLLILPVALLVTYSQLIVKWRAGSASDAMQSGFFQQIIKLLSDPWVLSGYAAALVASFAWLLVVTRLPLNVAFPAYIGVTFALVLLGSVFFLGEPLTPTKFIAVAMIFGGIALGMTSDA